MPRTTSRWDGLHRAMADDLIASFRDGVTVEAVNGAAQFLMGLWFLQGSIHIGFR